MTPDEPGKFSVDLGHVGKLEGAAWLTSTGSFFIEVDGFLRMPCYCGDYYRADLQGGVRIKPSAGSRSLQLVDDAVRGDTNALIEVMYQQVLIHVSYQYPGCLHKEPPDAANPLRSV